MSKPDAIANDPDASRIWDELLSQVKAAGTWEDKFEPMFAVLVNSIVAYWAVTRRLAELRAKNPAMGEIAQSIAPAPARTAST